MGETGTGDTTIPTEARAEAEATRTRCTVGGRNRRLPSSPRVTGQPPMAEVREDTAAEVTLPPPPAPTSLPRLLNSSSSRPIPRATPRRPRLTAMGAIRPPVVGKMSSVSVVIPSPRRPPVLDHQLCLEWNKIVANQSDYYYVCKFDR